MALQENFDIYFDTRFGGTNATIGGNPVVGIFDNEYVEIDNGVAPVVGTKPTLTVRDSDAVGAIAGTNVVVGSTNYKVIIPQPDGTGVTVLILERQ